MKHLLFSAMVAIAFMACSPQAANNTEQSAPATEQSATPKNHAEYTSPNADAQQEVFDFIQKKGVFYIATMDGDQPRVRPFGALHIFEGKMYIITGHVKRVAKQLAQNPKAEICAQGDNEWIRVAATMVEDERVEAKKAVLDAHPNLRSMYNENDDNIAVYYFTDATATISSFSGDQKTLNF
jgi:uncharacterized pyridoxamine 5'-phosphate oxidase family protein